MRERGLPDMTTWEMLSSSPVCLFVWVVDWLRLPYWFPPSACPPIEWPRWGSRGPALRASRVSGCSSTGMWGSGVHCLHSPSFGEPTGLREQSNDLCPTLRASHGTRLFQWLQPCAISSFVAADCTLNSRLLIRGPFNIIYVCRLHGDTHDPRLNQ